MLEQLCPIDKYNLTYAGSLESILPTFINTLINAKSFNFSVMRPVETNKFNGCIIDLEGVQSPSNLFFQSTDCGATSAKTSLKRSRNDLQKLVRRKRNCLINRDA